MTEDGLMTNTTAPVAPTGPTHHALDSRTALTGEIVALVKAFGGIGPDGVIREQARKISENYITMPGVPSPARLGGTK